MLKQPYVNNRRILLLLKTPPPFGGGEVLSAYLEKYVRELSDFLVIPIRSKKRTRINQGSFKLWKIGEFISSWWLLLMAVIKYRPRLIFMLFGHSFSPFFRDSVYFWTARLFRAKFCTDLAGERFSILYKNKLSRWYGLFVLSRLKCIRVLGENISNELKGFGITDVVIMDNGVSVPAIVPSKRQTDDHTVKFLFVGAHSAEKGLDVLLCACERLRNHRIRFELHTIGQWASDDYRKRVMKFCRKADLTDNIHLHGMKHGTEKWSIYSCCQIMILPSFTEGQPLVILEALACGMPIISTTVGGIPQIIENGVNGFLVNPGKSGELAEVMEILIGNSELRHNISERNKGLYQQRFTESLYNKTMVAWLRDCVEDGFKAYGQRYILETNEKKIMKERQLC